MRFTLVGDHKKFFHTHGFIEFDGLLTPEENADCLKSSRLAYHKQKKEETSLLCGRDLFRLSPEIKRRSRGFAHILFALTHLKPIRLAYDQLLSPSQGLISDEQSNLSEISSLQGEIFGLLLALEVDGSPLPAPFPGKEGNGVFFKSTLPLPLDKIQAGCYLLVVYSGESTVVVEKKSDPFFFSFKRLGYCIGDTLRNESHPIVFR